MPKPHFEGCVAAANIALDAQRCRHDGRGIFYISLSVEKSGRQIFEME
jgi:hypothetical protein